MNNSNSAKNMNANPQNLNLLLTIVGKKLGMPPDELRRQLEAGKFDCALGNMTPQEAQTLGRVMNDPQLAERMMSAPQAQALYKKLSGEK